MKRKRSRKNKIASFILNFCKEISDINPVIVPLRPLTGKPLNECVNIVPEHIREYGGKECLGWCIHIWKKVLIEAEFHCVWENPSGELIDLTPKKDKGDFIIFIPTPNIKYDGRQVNNIRKSLSIDKDIQRYINLWDEYFRYTNQGDLEDQYGEITIEEERFSRLTNQMVEIERKIKSKYGNKRTLSA